MDSIDRFRQMFGGTAFWNGLTSLGGQPKTPDPFEAPWESQAHLQRMGEAALQPQPDLPTEYSSAIVVK